LLSVHSDSNSNTGGKQKNERLRVTMVHGDIVVLSGSLFKASAMYLFIVYAQVPTSQCSFRWCAQGCVCVSGSITRTLFLADSFYIKY
jgi:hypothetical protein